MQRDPARDDLRPESELRNFWSACTTAFVSGGRDHARYHCSSVSPRLGAVAQTIVIPNDRHTNSADRSRPYLEDFQTIADAFGTDTTQGLSAEEARQRLARDGPNILAAEKSVPAWRHFLKQHRRNPGDRRRSADLSA